MNSLAYRPKLKKDLWSKFHLGPKIPTYAGTIWNPHQKLQLIHDPLCFQNPPICSIYCSNPQSARLLGPNLLIRKPIHPPPPPPHRLSCYSRLLKEGKKTSPDRFERTLPSLIFHFEGTYRLTLICVFPVYFKSQRSYFPVRDENKTLKVLHVRFRPHRTAITIVFLTLWLAGHLGCVWGRRSINNGVTTGRFFWPRA